MRINDLKQEIFQLRDLAKKQGNDIVGLMLECVRLKRILGEAVEDIRMLGRMGEFICPVCAHYNHGEGTSGECVKCLTGDGFRWRGEKEEDK